MMMTPKALRNSFLVVAGVVGLGCEIADYAGGRDDVTAVQTVEKAQLGNVKVTGVAGIADCPYGRTPPYYRTAFTATAANGHQVSGTVCQKMFKISPAVINFKS